VKVGSRRPQQLAPDPDLIRKLAGLLTETGLSEIDIRSASIASGSRVRSSPLPPRPPLHPAPPRRMARSKTARIMRRR
jgi:hypothetical protein